MHPIFLPKPLFFLHPILLAFTFFILFFFISFVSLQLGERKRKRFNLVTQIKTNWVIHINFKRSLDLHLHLLIQLLCYYYYYYYYHSGLSRSINRLYQTQTQLLHELSTNGLRLISVPEECCKNQIQELDPTPNICYQLGHQHFV